MLTLSVLVPVYNEEHLVATSLARLEVLESAALLSRVQVIVVDDCSTDGTPAILARFRAERGLDDGTTRRAASKIEWRFLRHAQNGGKGRAIQTALANADSDVTVIHD